MISIHAPREGSDNDRKHDVNADLQFLSTLPVRGATWLQNYLIPSQLFLSTLPVRGATDALSGAIHEGVFLSTLPVRGATQRHGVRQRQGSYFYPRSP